MMFSGTNLLDKVNITYIADMYTITRMALRSGIKDYSSWPTIPQVFINGEFVGGCDILLEMHKNGELVAELKKVGITSAMLEKEEIQGKNWKD